MARPKGKFTEMAMKAQSNVTYWELMAECFQSATQIKNRILRERMIELCNQAHRALKNGNRGPVLDIQRDLGFRELHHL